MALPVPCLLLAAAIPVANLHEEPERVVCTARVSPAAVTYLTVRYAGGAGAPHNYAILDADGTRVPGTELDESGFSGNRPLGFFYETVAIPQTLTGGKRQIELALGANGSNARKILGLYTHTNAKFVPPEGLDPGLTVKPYAFGRFKPFSKGLAALCRRRLVDLHDELVDEVMKHQFMDEKASADLVGAFDVPGCRRSDGSFDAEESKNRICSHYNHLNNMGPMLLGAVLANGYTIKGARHYRDRELLRRVALFLDFCRRAQSLSGTYYNVWDKTHWMGGPNRGYSSGSSLDGAGMRGIPLAFLYVAKDLEKEGLLDEAIDDDCDATTPKVPRRKAWGDLFALGAAYFRKSFGHAPNQETYQLDALRRYEKAAAILGAEIPEKPSDEDFDKRLRYATGAVPYGEGALVSPKGMPLEYGGYSVEYGRGQDEMYYGEWQSWRKDYLRERAAKGGNAFIPFVRPDYNTSGAPRTQVSGFLNSRHRNSLGGDGYWASGCQVADFRNPAHIRLWQLQNWDLTEDKVRAWGVPRGGNWWWSAAFGFTTALRQSAKLYAEAADPKSPLCANVHLPMEFGEPDFVAGDEVAQTVAFKDGEERVFLTFNMWNHKESPDPEGRAYVEYRSEIVDQFLRIPHPVMQEVDGKPIRFGVSSLVFGDWFIVQNCSFDATVEIPLPKGWAKSASSFKDLASGKKAQSGARSIRVKPQQTRVIKRESGKVRPRGGAKP